LVKLRVEIEEMRHEVEKNGKEERIVINNNNNIL
jgi:hypothetical protein